MPDATDDVLLPLEWDGHTLSIPNASPTQDGYLSTDAFVLFSGGTVVPVTSFNTRTGEVVLLEDDVLAALGYVPLNKHGDTMTGPLTLPGPPSLPLHAATRAYVDGISTGLFDGQYLASDFGASGSEAKFTGACTSGLKTLTLAAGSVNDFQVGQGILVTAGGSSGDLLTKVDAVSGLTITLHVTAGATRTATNVQHDDTVALQAALDNFATVGGGTLLIEPGFYRVNGPVGAFHSILKFPFRPPIAGTGFNISPLCYRIIAYNVPVAPGAGLPQEIGPCVIQSDKVDTTASILASGDATATPYDNLNYSIISIEGVTFRTYDNPQINGLDLAVQWNCFLKNVSFDTGMAGQSNIVFGGTNPGGAQPTHGTYALRLPRVNYCTQAYTENVTVSNYGIGVIGSELWHTHNTWIQRCAVGIQGHGTSWPANYPIVGDILIVQCTKSVDASVGRMRFDCHIDFETDYAAGVWWNPVNHFNDPGNTAHGIIRYINISAGSGGGASIGIVLSGGTGVSFQPTGF